MGRRTATETVCAVVVAFLGQRTWRQAELAREIGVQSRTLRRILLDLRAAGVPFEEERDPPNVFWSVPKHWVPGGVVLDGERAQVAAHLIARTPRTADRERVLRALFEALPHVSSTVVPSSDELDAAALTELERGCAERIPIRMRYYSASRGDHAWRVVSVHRLTYHGEPRFVATCHRHGELRWFRADRVDRAELAPSEPFAHASADAIDRFLRESVDGFHGPRDALFVAFFVRDPAARWVVRNLPGPLSVEPCEGGARISGTTAGLEVLARFVVGLGADARAETPELRDEVVRIARAALAAHDALSPRSILNIGAERRNQLDG